MKYVLLWLIGAVIYSFLETNIEISLINVIVPLFFSVLAIIFFNYLTNLNHRNILAYLLFFSTGMLSFVGIISPLTGSLSQSSSVYLFGFSFYSASLSFLMIKNSTLKLDNAFKLTNPLLLGTGPLALFIRNYRYRNLHSRVNYFFPYIIVGFFLFQIIGAPLVLSFSLINSTDVVSSIIFAIIFELFVYANFCGLSLIIYGIFGILGYKIPLNFKQPFSSRNIIEFWRGWHISLSAVLKYLFYTPLRKNYPPGIALIFVYLASAMWHGITFNFFIWGCFHSLIFIITLSVLKRNIRILPTILLIIGIILGRMIFADSDTDRLIQKLLFSYDGFGTLKTVLSFPTITKLSLIMGFGLVAIEFFFRNTQMLKKRNYKHLRIPSSVTVIIVVCIFLIDAGTSDYAVYGQR